MALTGWRYCKRIGQTGQIVLFLLGASNARGNNGETGDPAVLGYTLPVGVKLWEDGVLLTSYPTSHFGPEVGLIAFLISVCHITPSRITIVKLGVEGSNLAAWKSTHWANLNAVFATSGYPCNGLIFEGASDAGSALHSGNYFVNIGDLIALLRRDRGAELGIALVMTQNLPILDYPYIATVRAAQAAYTAVCQGLMSFEVGDLPVGLDAGVPNHHFTGPSQIIIGGARYGQMLLDEHVIEVQLAA